MEIAWREEDNKLRMELAEGVQKVLKFEGLRLDGRFLDANHFSINKEDVV